MVRGGSEITPFILSYLDLDLDLDLQYLHLLGFSPLSSKQKVFSETVELLSFIFLEDFFEGFFIFEAGKNQTLSGSDNPDNLSHIFQFSRLSSAACCQMLANVNCCQMSDISETRLCHSADKEDRCSKSSNRDHIEL